MFVVPPYYGHITPTLSIGDELIRRGHNVCWVSPRDISIELIPKGGQWIVPDEVRVQKDEVDRIMERQNIGTNLTDEETFDFIIYESLLPFAEILNCGIQAVIDRFGPDVIIHDESALAGAVAAVKNNIPYVTSITPPPGFFEPNLLNPAAQKILLDKMRVVQKKMGIDLDRVIFNSDKLVLSFTSPELIKPRYLDFVFESPIAFVGPAVKHKPEPYKFDWEQIEHSDWPIIYVSIGTVLDDIRSVIFKLVIEALSGQSLTVIVNTDPVLFECWPENFIPQKFCPQVDILSKVDLVITHAGFNTVNESLYFDTPLIALPLAWDQSVNANLISSHKCGQQFDYRDLHSDTLKNAVFDVLEDPLYRQNATRLGESLRSKGGTSRAADLIERLVA